MMVVGLSACYDRDDYQTLKGEKMGYIPVYSDTFRDFRDTIRSMPPKAIGSSGKIYLYLNWLFINESGKGVHVYDNSDPNNPMPICFLQIAGNYDILCKDNTLYAESYFGLIYFNISKLPLISDIKFSNTKDYPVINGKMYVVPGFPDKSNNSAYYLRRRTYFECIDHSKGYITGWTFGSIAEPQCHVGGDYTFEKK